MQSATSEVDRQLPVDEEIFLDHVGHFVPDPEAASRALGRAGFAPTPVSIQLHPDSNGTPRPTGTGTVTAMLARGYIEVLFKAADTPLGRELDATIARHAGIHLAAFAVADAAKAHRRLASAGFAVRPLVQMQRPVETETGAAVAAFTVARVEPGVMPEGRIQILTHRTEDAVWQKRWLAHRNGARGLASIVIAVADVDEAARRFGRFTGRIAARSQSGQTIRLDRGRVELVTRDAFKATLPEISIPSLPFAGAYGVTVQSLENVASVLRQGGICTRRAGRCLVAPFPDELGRGAWLFTESDEFSPLG